MAHLLAEYLANVNNQLDSQTT